MAKFTSRFPELGFYVNSELRKFYNGQYSTENDDEIKVLEKLADVVREDELSVEPKVDEAPKVKAQAKSKK